VRISDEILNRLVDAYRRIRNTVRFLLGNLSDFDPAKDAVALETMLPLDRFALDLVERRHRTILQAYEDFEFHKVYHTLHNLCTTDLSAFYLDIIKDRLYVCAGLERRSAQTVLWRALLILLNDMAPVLSFTAEEAYQTLPEAMRPGGASVFTMRLPEAAPVMSDAERQIFELLLAVRGEVTKAIEPMRKAGDIGHSLETQVTLYVENQLSTFAQSQLGDEGLKEFFIVSKVLVKRYDEAPDEALGAEVSEPVKILVGKSSGAKCQRCWRYDEMLGTDAAHPDICPRCTTVVHGAVQGS
jgi:isoleucyl-tRNA synthetase